MQDVARLLHRSTWRMHQTMASMKDRLRLSKSRGTSVWGRPTAGRASERGRNEEADFNCDPTKYTEARREFVPVADPRQPTELEWEIMGGIVEGSTVIRKLPQFLRRVCMGDNLLRFQLTIKAPVEGHLHGKLNDHTPMYPNHQTTKWIVDAILLAARQRREQDDDLMEMLRALKRVEYHAGTHSLFFFFFTRAEAAKWEGREIPFRRQKLRLTDVNRTQTSQEQAGKQVDVWKRQLGSDGAKNSVHRLTYRVQLLNITSFLDVGHFLALLKARLNGVELTAYSIDTPGPQSEYSQHWELQFPTSDCSAGLENVFRIFWINHPILVHHITVQRQPPCLVCGVSGHLARACTARPQDVKRSNSA
ncbi:hypothetical protein PybrP1_000086, partial [[Pythium] brassicae (nom. inval.)]